MKRQGHYCKVCDEYKAHEKFSGRGHAAHICRACAQLPPEEQARAGDLEPALQPPMAAFHRAKKLAAEPDEE